jgi:hypothetical protein
MFQIRENQAEAFRGKALADFEARALRHFRRDLGRVVQALPDTHLLERLRGCVQRAARYDLTTEKEVICFTDVSLLLGADFDTDHRRPWSREILQSRTLRPGDRANLLLATACSIFQEERGRP